MPKCQFCNKEIYPRDEDAGTSKELFCNDKCEEKAAKELESFLDEQESDFIIKTEEKY